MSETSTTSVTKEDPPREVWPSRTAFIFVSVGAAVGYGNVWRFPSLAYKYGGGAFFIPYFMALIFIGIPILILEICLGQLYRTGDVGSFGGMHRRLRGIGLSSVFGAYIVVIYYIPLIAWTVNGFFDTFSGFDEKYAIKTDVNGTLISPYAVHFGPKIIGMESLNEGSLNPTRLVPANVGYLALVYILMYCCVAFGIKVTGRIAYFTMGFPILLLFIFFFRGVTLDGASDGIKAYIGIWDLSVLREQGEVWSTAVSQIFFSIGISWGIFTAYGSACEKDAPAVSNAVIIAFANSFFSLIAGFAIFGALGNLASLLDLDVDKVAQAGLSLVFGAYPVVLAQLPNGAHWVRLFFFFLFLLGIDSGFAFMEAVLIVLTDTPYGQKLGKPITGAIIHVIAFVLGLLFVTDAGLFFLDVVDFYINYLLLFVGFLEAFAGGWVFGHEKQIESVGKTLVYTYMGVTFVPLFIASGFWWGLDSGASVWAGFVAYFVTYGAGMGVVVLLARKAAIQYDKSLGSVMRTLTIGNVQDLKKVLETHSGEGAIPMIWAVNMKHVMPQALILCFINLIATKVAVGGKMKPIFANYEGYDNWPYQTVGIIVFCVGLGAFLVGLFFPSLYDGLLADGIEKNVATINGAVLLEETLPLTDDGTKDAKVVFPVALPVHE